MSYHIYTTEGIILKRSSFGEANLLLHILTHDLGLIIASARSARVSASKLRPALQEYTLVSLSCVKSKNGWKVTNVTETQSFYFDYPDHTHRVVAQIVSVVLKMIPGESNHPEVFDVVKTSFNFLKELDKEDVESFEILSVLRILFLLGYVAKTSVTEEFLADNKWNKELLSSVLGKRHDLVKVLNEGLKASQL